MQNGSFTDLRRKDLLCFALFNFLLLCFLTAVLFQNIGREKKKSGVSRQRDENLFFSSFSSSFFFGGGRGEGHLQLKRCESRYIEYKFVAVFKLILETYIYEIIRSSVKSHEILLRVKLTSARQHIVSGYCSESKWNRKFHLAS